MSEPTITTPPRQKIGIDLANARAIRVRHLLVRFAFGALTSIVAAVVAITLEPRAGGIFLAFPAILAATITLIENEETSRAAREDARGAIVGGVALAAFAAVGAALFGELPSAAVLAVAAAVWAGLAIGAYLAIWRT